MTKGELVRQLAGLPDDALIVVNAGRNELANGVEATGVETIRQQAWRADAEQPGSRTAWHVAHYADDDPEYVYRDAINIYA